MRAISFLFTLSVIAVSAPGCFRSHDNGDEVDSDLRRAEGSSQAGGSPNSGGGETRGSGALGGADDKSGSDGTANNSDGSGGSGGTDPKDAASAGDTAGTGKDSSPACATGSEGVGGGNNTLTGHLESNVGDRIAGITVRALDTDTATVLYDETVSDENGDFTLTGLPGGQICVMAVGDYTQDPPRIDTYTFGVPSNSQDRMFVSSEAAIAQLMSGLLCLCGNPDPEVSMVSGAVYYYDEDCEEQVVGCATVEMEASGTVYYFEGPLPSTTRTSTDPNSGRFLVSGLEPGIVTITATLDNGKSGSATFPVFAPEEATGGEYSVHIARVYIEGIGNPNPECSN